MRLGGWEDIHPLAIIVPVTVAIVLLFIRIFVLMRMRDRRLRENRQETERLRSLVVAYRALAGSFTPAGPEHRSQVEEALADVVLFGTVRQVELAAACARALVAHEPVDAAALVSELRADLRQQLGLEPIPDTVALPPAGPGRPPRGARLAGEGGEGRPHNRWRPPG